MLTKCAKKVNVTELFGCDVFNDAVMEERLPKKVYKELKETIEEGKELSMEIDSRIENLFGKDSK